MIRDIYAAQEKAAFDIRPGDAIWSRGRRVEILYVAWAPGAGFWNEPVRVLYTATGLERALYEDDVVLQLSEAL